MIGKNIYRIRREKGITLSAVAEQANISKSYLSNLERGLNQNPSIYIMKKVSQALDVDLQEILGDRSKLPESEWLNFVNELKQSGVEKEQLPAYKKVIEFVKWQQENEHRQKQKNGI